MHNPNSTEEANARLFAEEVPGGDGPYCLLVHGFLSSRAQFRPNLAQLSLVCRPILVELWGHGRSPSPREPALYSVEAYIQQFEAVRSALKVARWFVFGQSFGAALALHYAARCPDAVLGLILTNSMAAFTPPEELARRGAKPLEMALEAGGETARLALASMPMHVSRARRLPEETKRELVADADLLDAHGVAQGMRYTAPQLSALSVLPSLDIPMLLINGRFERAFQPVRAALPSRLPNLEVLDLDAGHAVNAEQAEATNRAVGAFISRHVNPELEHP